MKPDQPAPSTESSKPATPRAVDLVLDPLPLPDVSESDTDTAWGLWEATLEGRPAPVKPGEAAPDFEPTQPTGLHDVPGRKP